MHTLVCLFILYMQALLHVCVCVFLAICVLHPQPHTYKHLLEHNVQINIYLLRCVYVCMCVFVRVKERIARPNEFLLCLMA